MTRCPRCRTHEPPTFLNTGQQITVAVSFGLFLSDPDSPARHLSSDQDAHGITTVDQLSSTCTSCGLVLLGFANHDRFQIHPPAQVRLSCRAALTPDRRPC